MKLGDLFVTGFKDNVLWAGKHRTVILYGEKTVDQNVCIALKNQLKYWLAICSNNFQGVFVRISVKAGLLHCYSIVQYLNCRAKRTTTYNGGYEQCISICQRKRKMRTTCARKIEWWLPRCMLQIGDWVLKVAPPSDPSEKYTRAD